jgi:hypothetical protein
MSFPSELKSVYREGRLLPFIGAGISMSVEWNDSTGFKRGPSWRELVDKAAHLMDFKDPDLLRVRGSDLQILEYFRIMGNASELTNWLVREINPPEDALRNSIIHKKLSELTNCQTFYTTNFDKFLEDAFKLLGRENKVVVKEQDMCKSKNGECEIIKFHGDLNNEVQLVTGLINQAKSTVYSLDIPSGLNGDSGEASKNAVHADYTIAFHKYKPIHIKEAAKDYCGRIVCVDIGIQE